jgi:hypothetical protein
MQRIAVVATLRPGTHEQAEKLVALGPPFDPFEQGLERHIVFLGADTAVFLFEGGNAHALLAAFTGPGAQSALGAWEPLVDGTPRIAREVYSWISPAEVRTDTCERSVP